MYIELHLAVDGQGIFHVIGGISAGSSARTLEIPPRHCYRINTGGVVPDDADTVVPVEYTQLLEHDVTNCGKTNLLQSL